MIYINLKITINQKPTKGTQKAEKGTQTNTKLKEQNTREEIKRRKEQRTMETTKTINKMAISTYLPVITLHVNGLNASLKRHRMAE